MRRRHRARTAHGASLAAIASLTACCAVSCARPARDVRSTAVASTDSTQRAGAVCGLDPDVPWITAQDRACERDVDCTTVVASQCAMFAVAARAAASVTSGEHACPPLPSPLTGCMCATPVFEQRCHSGCCQSRIAGSNGTWRPLR